METKTETKAFLTPKEIAEIAIAAALGLVLSYISKMFFQMPQGGNISLGMIPIFYLALKRGLKSGLIAGTILGLLHLITDFYVIHPVQLFLDYPLPNAALGLAGIEFFRKKVWWLGVIAGGFGRFFFHFISGVIFFGSYAPEGQSPVLYSLIYNGSYILPGVIIALIVVAILRRYKALW